MTWITRPLHTAGIHPQDKQDVAFRMSLGARAVAYGEQDVAFRGPFPSQILSTPNYLEVAYDQEVSVTPFENIFEICAQRMNLHHAVGSDHCPDIYQLVFSH
ncbi:sialate O-acetylesterase-like [Gymnodraco acuticeps]|uniref:Sialate O-acetylesterase-like n=1 Tax=Gymnodraco acuticeps TaxID=8218 RepID=A0A6P8TXI4_GYMAC|nr:sialate O-acetylesterase-like [Gymnodraco acuticeps]